MFCPYCGIDDVEITKDVHVEITDFECLSSNVEYEDLTAYKCRQCYFEFLC